MSTIQENTPKSGFRKFYHSLAEWFEYKDKGKWIEEMKTVIGLAASMIATMTFALGTNPPGGVVQAGISDVSSEEVVLNKLCSIETRICAGSAVLGSLHTDYLPFLVCNTTCFISALSVIFLLVSGIPTNHTFTIWLISSCMCVTLTFLALTYLFAAIMVTPNSIWRDYNNVFAIALMVWAGIVVIFQFIVIVRFIVRKCSCICK